MEKTYKNFKITREITTTRKHTVFSEVLAETQEEALQIASDSLKSDRERVRFNDGDTCRVNECGAVGQLVTFNEKLSADEIK